MRVERFETNPIIRPNEVIGSNINGPSLIRAPDWLPDRLGRYYLYFAHHRGEYIRLAYADALAGPWSIYEPGTLQLAETRFPEHIASPDVHVDDGKREIRMYFHGAFARLHQHSGVALSQDGIHFRVLPQALEKSYYRVFEWKGYHYALAMPGVFYRSKDGLTDFERGPTLFTKDMRHSAVKLDGDILSVFYSNAHDTPERILLSTIELTADWMSWQASEPRVILEPEMDYEGADLPLEPSERDWAPNRVRQLRDPAIYREGEDTYLLYSVAGEHGIAMAKLID